MVDVNWSPTEARVDPLQRVRGVESFWRPLAAIPGRASAAAVKLTRKIALAEAASTVANQVLSTAARSSVASSATEAGTSDAPVLTTTGAVPVSAAQAAVTSDAGAIPVIKARAMSPFRLDLASLRSRLAGAPSEAQVLQFPGSTAARRSPLVISLPAPGGNFERFEVWTTPVAAPEVLRAAKMQTYAGRSLDDTGRTVRFDVSPRGLRAMTLGGEGGTYYIDPIYHGDTTSFASYWRTDVLTSEEDAAWRCVVEPADIDTSGDGTSEGALPSAITDDGVAQSGAILRTYRMAVAATGEYTTFHGGQTQALAAIVTSVNRITGLYERDLSIRFTLVANNINIVYTNAATDPFTNQADGAQLTVNDNTIDSVIGSANYDIGHLFATSSGGIAQLNSVGGNSKGRGISGSPSPVNDAFDIDYVAHEVGHQFGGNHTFANCGGSNAGTSVDMEPGSGVTIMAYAGICGSTNLQSNSDAMFHTATVDEIIAFVDGATTANIPARRAATGNAIPDVNVAATTYTIPARTPFELVATGSDANATDTLTYSWEQRDEATSATPVDNSAGTSGPVIRTFNPTTSPNRTVPRLSNLLANTNVTGERLPTASRTLNFRVMVRDNRAGGGAVAYSNTALTVVGNSAGFAVTAPNTAVTWSRGSSVSVTWNNIGTQTNAAMGATNVNITLSTDGGNTWPITLVGNTANDGTETFTLPTSVPNTTTARIRVQPTNNIFFDVSNANFTITGPVAPTAPSVPSLAAASDTGSSSSDRITRLGNASPASALTFSVAGVTSGNTVNLYAGSTLVGSAVAAGTSVNITTDGASSLADGVVSFTAEQVTPGGTSSARSTGVNVTIDTTAPVASLSVGATVRNNAVSNATITYSESVSGVALAGNVSLTADGVPVTVSAPTLSGSGASYVIGGLAAATGATADYALTFTGAGVTDTAGNPAASASLAFARNVINLSTPAPGQSNLVRLDFASNGIAVNIFVNNTTATADFTGWGFSSSQVLRIDGSSGDDVVVVQAPAAGSSYSAALRFVTAGGLDRFEAARGTVRADFDLGPDVLLSAGAGSRLAVSVAQPSARGFNVDDNGTLAYSANLGPVVLTSASVLSVAPLGYVDLANNPLVVRNADASSAAIRELARRFVASVPAAPRGLGSSLATPGTFATIRPAVFANRVAAGVGFFSNYAGIALGADDVLVEPLARTGDTDLSGSVDGSDLRRLIEGFSTARVGWLNGDLDHDGDVDATDFSIYRTVNA